MHSGSSLGYRQMHQRITLDHGKVVDRETIRQILQVLDPEGVSQLVRHKLLRQKYISKGPNYIWHIDSYDKLKPFGFCIQLSYPLGQASGRSTSSYVVMQVLRMGMLLPCKDS